ncbi:hypothetical protein EGR_11248 [Echinococcus granulosus]|uniref:Uncharacterized protein n=1 Tax=Echinococcus granulosus TaxID=6210 RepID=W6TYN6_ECHGR|nr:hypothetical protein EGR_11248 [Echinococcus granulosus]EUB53895.1 hypothetical protein EGR_11248 [Echinococcus granulosus]
MQIERISTENGRKWPNVHKFKFVLVSFKQSKQILEWLSFQNTMHNSTETSDSNCTQISNSQYLKNGHFSHHSDRATNDKMKTRNF